MRQVCVSTGATARQATGSLCQDWLSSMPVTTGSHAFSVNREGVNCPYQLVATGNMWYELQYFFP